MPCWVDCKPSYRQTEQCHAGSTVKAIARLNSSVPCWVDCNPGYSQTEQCRAGSTVNWVARLNSATECIYCTCFIGTNHATFRTWCAMVKVKFTGMTFLACRFVSFNLSGYIL